ncbi:MAG: glycosyltransferase [Planctomycetota bacterium]
MPPRVAYWLSSFEPEMEAIAGEVACLRRAYPGSIAWGVGPRNWVRLSWRRGFGVHPRLHWAFRAAAAAGQGCFDVNHLFGGLGDWFHLRALRRRASVLTMALDAPPCDELLLGKIDRFVTEWPGGRDKLQQLGIEPGRIRLVFPPVDLDRFQPAAEPDGPFTVLFCSSPDAAQWLEPRGVRLLLDAAALRPTMRFRLIWRPWGDSLPVVRQWIADGELDNVELVVGRFADMQAHYAAAHVTVAPFLDGRRSKAAPNSLIESMACGRPVAATAAVGLADVIEECGAGQIFAAEPAALTEALDRLQGDWSDYARRSRLCAEQWFDEKRFLAEYQQVYGELTARRAARTSNTSCSRRGPRRARSRASRRGRSRTADATWSSRRAFSARISW